MLSINSLSSLPSSDNSGLSLKFVLFLKNKEINEIKKVLNKAMLLSQIDKESWKEEYGEMIDQALNLFVDDSNLILKRLSLDEEILELSHQLVSSIQEVMRLADAILGTETQLSS
jgi:hypothetical protein